MTSMKLFICVLFSLFSFPVYSMPGKSILENSKQFNRALAKKNVWGAKIFIGYSNKGKPIYAYYYNKGGKNKVLVIAGVHGSEFYGVDVAFALKDSLDHMKISASKWRILIIPELFADNVEEGRKHIFQVNWGRKTCNVCFGTDDNCIKVDPNRQMPAVNNLYHPGENLSGAGDTIETENCYLLYVTQQFNPSRIISIHCKNEARREEIGIYTDPRTTYDNIALGYADDAVLAIKMAFVVKEQGGVILGNFVGEKHTKTEDSCYVKPASYFNSIYPQDPPAVNKGEKQERNNGNNQHGISFGTWASTEIRINKRLLKKAATTITIELPQYYSFFTTDGDITSLQEEELRANTAAYVKAIMYVFAVN
jgi:hypothetical protein